MDAIAEIRQSLDRDLEQLRAQGRRHDLLRIKSRYLGRKGEISALLRNMGGLSPEQRPAYGQQVNALRNEAEEKLAAAARAVEEREIEETLKGSRVDPSLPGWRVGPGSLHPVNRVREEIVRYFFGLGFEIAAGPEIDTDWYNFEALNIPPDHSSRDMHDTFYVDDKVVLRTHTSNVQIHAMEKGAPPLRLIAPGVAYRVDNDATHSPMFQQVECLVVDEGVSFAHLKGTLYAWAGHMFGEDVRLRFRPSYFPFTEPSAEMDISCIFCRGEGCRVCKSSGWLEIGGCGCVDPNVLANVGWDAETYTGFAFGFGIDRIAMLRYGIPDISLLTRNDERFLRQF